MPWNEVTTMSLRKEFLLLAQRPGANLSELCRRFGISRKTAYKWIRRFAEGGEAALADRSRRPKTCPHQTPPEMEDKIRHVRLEQAPLCGRKIRRILLARGESDVPAASTVTQVLRRLDLLDEETCKKREPGRRFEREQPNELWQMDFKGDFPTLAGRCHPLTILDDHCRFLFGLFAGPDQRGERVQACLEQVFRRYGLPLALLMDNGSPWGGAAGCEHTRLSVWLMRLGIAVRHGRPYHPQTQGKVERFHRTLTGELLNGESFRDLAHCQERFDRWRHYYNYERPHDALDLATPGSRYRPSPLPYPETLPPIEYEPGREVRKVQSGGRLVYRGVEYRVGTAFLGLPVALAPGAQDHLREVYFCRQRIARLDLTRQTSCRLPRGKDVPDETE